MLFYHHSHSPPLIRIYTVPDQDLSARFLTQAVLSDAPIASQTAHKIPVLLISRNIHDIQNIHTHLLDPCILTFFCHVLHTGPCKCLLHLLLKIMPLINVLCISRQIRCINPFRYLDLHLACPITFMDLKKVFKSAILIISAKRKQSAESRPCRMDPTSAFCI